MGVATHMFKRFLNRSFGAKSTKTDLQQGGIDPQIPVRIAFASETGTAEVLASDLKKHLSGRNDCTIADLDDVDPTNMSAEDFYVVLCSSTGTGDVPSNGRGFLDALRENQPDLGHVRFAIFGLGDTHFAETFNQASEKIMDELLACGGNMIGERGLFDASSDALPEDVALPWFDGLKLPET